MAGGKGWARVEDVTFAAPPGAKTPQGYNYLAFPEEESRRLAPDHWARGWHDLVSELARNALSHAPVTSSSRATSSGALKK